MRLILAALLVLILSPAPASPQDPAAPAAWLRQLRFSPDGQHVLAQDDAEITVLTVRPFEVLFRMPAENATLAQFTPDSTQVVFVSSVPRVDPQQVALSSGPAHVERWNIVGHTRTALTDVPLHACGTVALSPDGRIVVCVDLQGTLDLIDVISGETVFEKKKFGQQEYLRTLERPCPCSTCKISLVSPSRDRRGLATLSLTRTASNVLTACRGQCCLSPSATHAVNELCRLCGREK